MIKSEIRSYDQKKILSGQYSSYIRHTDGTMLCRTDEQIINEPERELNIDPELTEVHSITS